MPYFLALILVLLAGCATSNPSHSPAVLAYSYDPDASLALNVARAAGIAGISDLPYEEYAALVEANPELSSAVSGEVRDVSRANLPVAAAAARISYVSPPTGLSPGAGSVLSAISWLSAGEMVPARETWFIAWLPEGKTLQDLEAEFLDALFRISPLSEQPHERTVLDADSSDPRPYYHTPDCARVRWARMDVFEADCSLGMTFATYWLDPEERSYLRASSFPFPEPRPAPQFLGGGGERAHGPVLFGIRTRGVGELAELGDEGILQLSANLPAWVYIYYARAFTRDFTRFTPVVLNSGEAHYFIGAPTRD
ncbi:hypothetical protein CAI21_14280 [Alkalilimnicola ehrlichii]|uniref:Uncharacterized protein n=1 Tax=Alkalilimnicola ehrlichii TaxID=351052 RepID=A0A3E0WNE9_9GAMM|nr:hypothetical protein [Alkalilimnicola ehrlichii]RFA27777.1 hypothetical protein CAI21_14280 [Alkalilimnicola ehrlichii]RFA33577.1 hypothetical protein CAL65_17140 [Alkalilimnicola ehrlichii]